jgi:photosystem II stability/assembly factor-like uncharacterized protein
MPWTHFDEPKSIFALAPLSSGACLAATGQGLWGFDPRKKTWTQTAPQFAQVPLTSVAAHSDTWLIGANGDIAVSRDGGATWSIATLPVKAHILGLAMSPVFDQDGLALAATAKDGVLRSADHGANWHAWNYGLLDLGVNALALSPAFAEDVTCYAATDHAVFMSTNGGRAWQELGAPMDAGPFTSLALAETRHGASLYAGTEGNGLWHSVEPFNVWQQIKGFRADEVNFLLADPLIAASTLGVYSAGNGRWAKLSEEPDAVCLAKLDDGAVVVGTAGSGLWHGKL